MVLVNRVTVDSRISLADAQSRRAVRNRSRGSGYVGVSYRTAGPRSMDSIGTTNLDGLWKAGSMKTRLNIRQSNPKEKRGSDLKSREIQSRSYLC